MVFARFSRSKTHFRTPRRLYRDDAWVRVAPSFTAFLRTLRQEADPPGEEAVRRMLERDDAGAMRAHLGRLPPGKMNEPDAAAGHALLQRAADAGAAKTVRLLLARGAKGLIGLTTANWRGHVKVVSVVLGHGYKPTTADWRSAVAAGSPGLLRTYLRLAPAPRKALLRERLVAARNLLGGGASRGRREVVRMLSRLVDA